MNMSITQELVEKKYRLYHNLINEALASCFSAEAPVTLYAPAKYIFLMEKGKESDRF